MFSRIAIVNRGEAAMRLIHAVRDLSAQTGARIETVALYTDAGRGAMFVREADRAYSLGATSACPYLDHAVLERALVETGADAAWPGWGFVAEDPVFAELCETIGVAFVGPDAKVMRQLGNEIGAKLIAERAGVPVTPWSWDAVATLDDAPSAAERTGYPLMKATATIGGGGRGIHVSTSSGDLTEAFGSTSTETLRAFDNGTVFLEQLLTGARHVEVQLIADGQGTVWTLGVRACSVQWRNQKIIEEPGSPVLEPTHATVLKASAQRLALAVGYRGAATVEFLYHPGEKRFAFLKFNPRLPSEHPVTELTTGVDLVRLQLQVAAGGRLHGSPPAESGHAVNARLTAEDLDRDFVSAPGRITRLVLPSSPGIRVDTGRPGRVGDELRRTAREHPAIALVATAIEVYEDEEKASRQQLLATAHGGLPRVRHDPGRPLDLKLHGTDYQVYVARTGPARYRAGINAGAHVHPAHVEFERFDRHSGRITVNGHRFRLTMATHGPVHLVEVDGITHRISRHGSRVIRSAAPALVVATPLSVGDEVEAGAPILVLESMKMETVLSAPFRARVRELPVTVSSQVEAGAPLMRLDPIIGEEPVGDAPAGARAADINLPALPSDVPANVRAVRCLDDLRGQLLGFDGDAADAGRLLADYLAARAELGDRLLPGEPGLLAVFADLTGLSDSRSASGTDGEPGLIMHSAREYFHRYLQSLDAEQAGTPQGFQDKLAKVLGRYGVTTLERTPELETAIFRVFLARARMTSDAEIVTGLLRAWLASPHPAAPEREPARLALEHLIESTQGSFPAVAELARSLLFRWFRQPLMRRNRAKVYTSVRADLRYLDRDPDAPDRASRIQAMVAATEPLLRLLGPRVGRAGIDNSPLLEVMTRRYYGNRKLEDVTVRDMGGGRFVTAAHSGSGGVIQVAATAVDLAGLPGAIAAIAELAAQAPATGLVTDLYVTWDGQPDTNSLAARLGELLAALPVGTERIGRITITVASTRGAAMHHHFTFRPGQGGLAEDRLIRGLHPQIAWRLKLGRLREFDLTRLPSADEEIYLFQAVARSNQAEERLFAMGQVRDLTRQRDEDGRLTAPELESMLAGCLDAIRGARARRPQYRQFDANRILIYVWPLSEFTAEELGSLAHRFWPAVTDAGLEEVQFVMRHRGGVGEPAELGCRVTVDACGTPLVHVGPPPTEAVQPLDNYRQKVLRAARRGNVYPYELTGLLAGPDGSFSEHDLDATGALVPADRPKGKNTAAIVAGVVTTPTAVHPGGVTRVVLLGDPTRSLGALAEPECARVIAALDLAERMRVPLEWFALSSGARISMTSGTENMDWVGAALKRIVEFTQAGGEINIVIAGITVGAQPYWSAEATMLMHTKGILVMTPDSAMVLTGKQSLDFSGGVSAEDNFGIGGYDRVMGPNGQAQYWAPNLAAAREILMAHYDYTYVVPGETAPRRAVTTDPVDRDVCRYPHAAPGSDFTTVGEIFSAEHNPDRKKPFDIRTVMRAVSDQDHPLLERWAAMADADTSVVADARIGGHPVCVIGIESRPVPRHGFPPADGPGGWTAGTLFPQSSKKTARAINAASGNRPLVVLANLSGFDGSPESMRKLQLEYGAEIGRAVVNFRGPIVFCVISRYHGGAFVVFSKVLNPRMTVLALEGSFASVLGGAPAAAVVFSSEVTRRTAADPRVTQLQAKAAVADGTGRALLARPLTDVQAEVRAEKLGEVATEFDRVHSIQRAVEVGSVDAIVSAARLRPAIIEAIGRGLCGEDR